MQEVFSYVMVEAFCFILLLVIFIKTDKNRVTEYEFYAFRFGIAVFFSYLAIDIICNLGKNHFIPFPRFLSIFANGMVLFLLCLLCFVWLVYSQMALNGKMINSFRYLILSSVPLALSAFLCICSLKTGWIYYVTEEGLYQRGPLYIIQLIIDYFYYIWSTVFAIFTYFSSKERLVRIKALTIGGYIILPTLGGITQIFVPGTPIVAMSIFIPTFLVFVSFQNIHIFKDTLTGLNNRRRADIFIENLLNSIRKNNSYYLFLFDINNFKYINDNFGHLEGDKALEYTSRCLKYSAEASSGFLARYGGDEFIIIASADAISDPDDFVSQLNANLHEFCKIQALPYNLTLSVGYVQFDNPDITSDEIFAEADFQLYENKRNFHGIF